MENVRSLWLRPRKARRGEPPLTLTRIAEAAVELLDAEGIDRLTMRRLAERLAISAPSLYWHVDTKDDVLDLAVDAIFGELTPAPRDDGWRANVTEVITAWRTVLLRHPWAASVPARRRPAIGPNFLTWMERLQAALAAAGFTGSDLAAATWAMYNHVFGSATAQTALSISAEERRIAQEKLHADGFPTLAASGYFYDDDWDGGFARGLEFLLDGLELTRTS